MKQLPTGLHEFEYIRRTDTLYVDKTDMIYGLVSGSRKHYFLSRPRRFGKSLTCWTLDALFSGKRELFEGLAISKTDWKWESYPVIHLDMSTVTTDSGVDGVRKSLTTQTGYIARAHGIDLRGETIPAIMLGMLLVEIPQKYGKPAVVIVDEYDKPFLEFYNKPPMAREVRGIMRDYYSQFKANEHNIRFLFMTGISKFTKAGVFSTLNNLYDLSLDRKFGTLLGYTEKELVGYFQEHLDAAALDMGISVDELIEKLRNNYNGFCFDGVHRVYCPFSVLSFFGDNCLSNYWMESGGVKVIADYMRDRRLTVEQFIGMQVTKNFVKSPGEIETAPPESFLYQAGYLTLREGIGGDFTLDYPNAEVLESMSQLVTMNIVESAGGNYFIDFRTPLLDALRDGDAALFAETVNRLLASIPYDDYAHSARSAIRQSKLPAREWLYRAMLLSFLHGCGVLAFGEIHTSKGRSDLLICYGGSAWVVEIKVAYDDDCKTKADEALKQLTDKQYDAPYNNAKKLGVAIDDKTRQIGEWVEG